MLKQPLPARARKFAGSMCVAMIVGCGTWAAWAAQPGEAGQPTAKPAYFTSLTAKDVLTAPAYPKGAKVRGLVELDLVVGTDGKVKQAKVVRSEPAGMFDQAALDAVKSWYISPGTMATISSAPRVRVPLEFSPDGAPKGE